MTALLEVADVTVRFGLRTVLDRVTLDVAAGEVIALLGPSGSGKSTLLRVVAGLLAPDGGTVRIAARDVTDVPTHRRGVGMVFQDDQLFPHFDVAGNVGFGLRMPGVRRGVGRGVERGVGSGVGRLAVARRVEEMLALVGLAGFGDRSVDRLSGGEAKRVALARSLAPAPSVLLLDEPLTGLDRELHDRLVVDLAGVLRTTGTTTVLVTHDHDEAAAVADRTVRLDAPDTSAPDAAAHSVYRRSG